MSTQTNAPLFSILAAAALVPFRLITSDGNYAAADTARDWMGATQEDAASGQEVTVRMPQAGTMKIEAGGVIAKDALVRKAANGRVISSGTDAIVGIALEAASGAGSIIEVMPQP